MLVRESQDRTPSSSRSRSSTFRELASSRRRYRQTVVGNNIECGFVRGNERCWLTSRRYRYRRPRQLRWRVFASAAQTPIANRVFAEACSSPAFPIQLGGLLLRSILVLLNKHAIAHDEDSIGHIGDRGVMGDDRRQCAAFLVDPQ